MKDVMIIANPSSGQEQAEEYSLRAKEILEQHQRHVERYLTESEEDVINYTQQAAREQYKTIVILGGDGTVSTLATSLKDFEYRPEVAIIPTGTVNNVARALNIDTNLDNTVAALPDLKPQTIDAGEINGQVFLSLVSAGTIPESVFDVSEDEKKQFGPFAYLIEGIQALDEQENYHFNVTIDHKTEELDLDLLMIGVSSSVVGLTHFFKDASYNDGKLHIFGMQKATLGERVKSIAQWLFNDEQVEDNTIITADAESIRIELLNQDRQTRVAVDGDEGPTFPVEINILPSYMRILAPDTEK